MRAAGLCLLAVVALLVFVACATESDDGLTATVRPATSVPTLPPPEMRCEEIVGLAERVMQELRVADAALLSVYVVRSTANTYFIGAEVDAPGWEQQGDVMVWATDDLESGQLYAISGAAKEFSDWPPGDASEPPLSMDTDGARIAELCAERG